MSASIHPIISGEVVAELDFLIFLGDEIEALGDDMVRPLDVQLNVIAVFVPLDLD